MNKRLLIGSILGLALIGGVAFASNQPVTTSDQPAVITESAQVEPTTAQPSPQTTETAPDVAVTAEASTTPTTRVTAPTAPETAPQSEGTPTAPAVDVPTPPPTILRIDGSGVSSIGRPVIDSFNCHYYFSDGTSVTRRVPYSVNPEGGALAICPTWE